MNNRQPAENAPPRGFNRRLILWTALLSFMGLFHANRTASLAIGMLWAGPVGIFTFLATPGEGLAMATSSVALLLAFAISWWVMLWPVALATALAIAWRNRS